MSLLPWPCFLALEYRTCCASARQLHIARQAVGGCAEGQTPGKDHVTLSACCRLHDGCAACRSDIRIVHASSASGCRQRVIVWVNLDLSRWFVPTAMRRYVHLRVDMCLCWALFAECISQLARFQSPFQTPFRLLPHRRVLLRKSCTAACRAHCSMLWLLHADERQDLSGSQ